MRPHVKRVTATTRDGANVIVKPLSSYPHLSGFHISMRDSWVSGLRRRSPNGSISNLADETHSISEDPRVYLYQYKRRRLAQLTDITASVPATNIGHTFLRIPLDIWFEVSEHEITQPSGRSERHLDFRPPGTSARSATRPHMQGPSGHAHASILHLDLENDPGTYTGPPRLPSLAVRACLCRPCI